MACKPSAWLWEGALFPETLLEGWETAVPQVFQSLQRLRVSHLNLPIQFLFRYFVRVRREVRLSCFPRFVHGQEFSSALSLTWGKWKYKYSGDQTTAQPALQFGKGKSPGYVLYCAQLPLGHFSKHNQCTHCLPLASSWATARLHDLWAVQRASAVSISEL